MLTTNLEYNDFFQEFLDYIRSPQPIEETTENEASEDESYEDNEEDLEDWIDQNEQDYLNEPGNL